MSTTSNTTTSTTTAGGGGCYSTSLPAARWTHFPIRVRPHHNPLADAHTEPPVCPADVPWAEFYPSSSSSSSQQVELLDVGCGYGGLLVKLAPLYPDVRMLGMEIRDKVASFVQARITALRNEHTAASSSSSSGGGGSEVSHHYQNVWVVCTNAMKYLPNYIRKGQLRTLLICFPDPHFKKRNTKRRIVSATLVAEYGYVVGAGGKVYVISDVREMWEWMTRHFQQCPLFELLPKDSPEVSEDPLIPLIQSTSEDAARAARKLTGDFRQQYSVFRRRG